MGLINRLNRLEKEYGPELCEERYCKMPPTYVEVNRYPDGTEERAGEEPPPLCPTCPYRDDSELIRIIEVVLPVEP